MALEPVVLDDLTWAGMMEAIRRRIPAASGGAWSLHAPVDAGMTLLELYAWLLEQRVYWLDQTPDALVHAALRLLDVRAFGTRAARTVLCLQPLAGHSLELSARTAFRVSEAEPPLVFTTLGDTLLLDVNFEVAATARAGSDTRRLSPPGELELFRTDGGGAEARFDFALATPPPADPRRAWKVLIELDTSPRIAPEWHPSAARLAPPPAHVRWWISAAGGRTELTGDRVRDGTLGFRRPGLLELRPAGWQPWRPEPNGDPVYSVWATVDDSRFVYRPRLRRLVPNAVVAEHRRRVHRARLTLDPRPSPARELGLELAPLRFDGDGPFERDVEVRLLERDGVWHSWTATDELQRHGPDARVFEVDRARQRAFFGDGYHGRIPTPASNGVNARFTAAMGGGPRGNVGRGLDWEFTGTQTPPLSRVANAVEGVGGDDAETIDLVRARCAAAQKQVTRAVLKSDYEDIALATPGVDVARAYAALGAHPRHACPVAGAVTVFVVPWAPRDESLPEASLVRAPFADTGMLRTVRARLRRRRLVGSEVFVRPASYRRVALSVTVAGAVHDPRALQARIERALRRFLDPLPPGGDGGGWPFGAPLRPSALVRAAQVGAGDKLEVRSVAVALDGTGEAEDCADVPIGAHALVALTSCVITLVPHQVTVGGLR